MLYAFVVFLYTLIGFFFVKICGEKSKSRNCLIFFEWPLLMIMLLVFIILGTFVKLGEFILKKLGD